MSDLFSPLHEPEQLPVPDPADVRHRGDALRRRRQALQAGGVAAAVVAVVLAAVSLTGGSADRSSTPPVATRPDSPAPHTSAPPSEDPSVPVGTVTAIPAGLDLVRDWVDDDGSGAEVTLRTGPDVQWLGDVVECEASHSPRDEEVDHLASVYSQPELLQARDLRTFTDDATARRVAEDYVSWFRDCPTFSIDDGASQTHNAVSGVRLGDQSWLVSQTYWDGRTPQLAENVLVVTRVANTILVTRTYGESPGATDPAASERVHDQLVADTAPVVDDLECTFADVC